MYTAEIEGWHASNIYSDGTHVRKPDIKTSKGKIFQRDRTKLILLELDWED